jgi:hypothetical protein
VTDADLRQTGVEVAHWRLAVDALADLDGFAPAESWRAMEQYLQQGVRERMSGMVAALSLEARALELAVEAGRPSGELRQGVLRLRQRYLQVETVLDFFGDAIGARANPALGDLLRGYDTLAGDSMAASLGPLGIDAPLALVYLDKGLGASILRAGIRLWDESHPSPAASIKLTRHNLTYPTALLHETGHQVGHLTGWNAELADHLAQVVAPHSREVAELWRSWSGEVAADVHAFVQTGWAPVAALANVVDGPTSRVFPIRFGDPHPPPYLRVKLNVALCRSWYGAGPWDRVGRAWSERHPVPPGDLGAVVQVSTEALGDIVDVCTRRPMTAFRGAPITTSVDPRRVSPAALADLTRRAGPSLLTSSYLRRRDPLRILALLAVRAVVDPARAGEHRLALRTWVSALGREDAGRTTLPQPRVA